MASNVLSTVSENNDVTEPDFQTALTNLVAAAPEDSQLIRQIISEYGTLVMELGNLRKTLLGTIALLTALRGEVDKIHKRSNGIVVARGGSRGEGLWGLKPPPSYLGFT